jgi:predicted dinucleotide-binding enzyme
VNKSRGTIGIIGAGKSGVAIARLALAARYTVKIASSGPSHETALMVDIVSPGAIAVDIEHVADNADTVILAVPLRRFRDLPLHLLSGHTVIDVMNYWPPIDGVLPEFENSARPSSVIVAEALPATAEVVKTFNHLGYHQMEDLARPHNDADRVAMGVAGPDTRATRAVEEFIDAVGFDAVYIGPLENSSMLQPDTPIFGSALDAATLREHTALARN